jgi:L-alanine-DL-glutamate epimerase-like enolase superfamily enzyme
MTVSRIDVYPVRVPYRHLEQSSVISMAGISNVLVKLTTDDGLVGWGESSTAATTDTIASAIKAAGRMVVGRNPWHSEAIMRDILVRGRWRYQETTAAFALVAIDTALWDLCGKASGQPLHHLWGGPVHESLDYFYYLHWTDDDGLASQCRDGLARGYTVYYLKVGTDERIDERRLGVLRSTLGAQAKIRIDANQSWSPDQALRLLSRWHALFNLDFAEGPIPHHPVEVLRDLKQRVPVPICADEGLRGEDAAWAVIQARAADYLCLSPSDVGTLSRFRALAGVAARLGQRVCRHTWGETGILATACHHACLTLANVCDGNQQTAQMMAEDVIRERLPITDGPTWGLIDGPGLGVTVDEDRVARFHEAYLREGEYPRAAAIPRS